MTIGGAIREQPAKSAQGRPKQWMRYRFRFLAVAADGQANPCLLSSRFLDLDQRSRRTRNTALQLITDHRSFVEAHHGLTVLIGG